MYWYSYSKFFENSCEDISFILMTIFVEKLFHRTVRGPTACNFNRKAPFIWVLQGFTELLKNSYFKDHHSMAASKLDASEIFWNFERSLWLENWLLYHIKHKTTCLLLYFWKYEDIHRKVIKSVKNNQKNVICNEIILGE